MGENTKIEWPDSSWSPWWGCTEISPGCENCYAREITHGAWGNHPCRRTSPKYRRQPLCWNADAPRSMREHGQLQRVFNGHICDFFDNQVDPQWRADVFRLIRETPNLDCLPLTKRASNICKMLPADWGAGYPNVCLGISAENQHYFDQPWKFLAAVPAVIRFVSYEPALKPLTLRNCTILTDWIIAGGESGRNARDNDLAWYRRLRDECRECGVAFFMKQMHARRFRPICKYSNFP
jgi:protein gp37